MNKTLISVIVPCYNQAGYLDECLQSVLDQSYDNWECIIVDDGSTDNTESIASKWCKIDSRFDYYHKDNGGLCSARNYGIMKSNGSYILPLDSDDKIGPEYLEKGILILEGNTDIGVVYCDARFFGAINRKWILPDFNKKYLLCTNLLFCSGIYRKEDFNLIGGYDENMKYGWEDWEFWINLLYSLNKTAHKLKYEGFYYRQKDTSMLKELSVDKTRKLKMYDYIYKKHKVLYDNEFNHPIVSYGDLWRLENKNKLLVHYLKKLKYYFTNFKL